MLTPEERCQRMQDALIEASKRTMKPFRTGSYVNVLRGADILVGAYRSKRHPKYIFKQLRRSFSEHWTEQLDGPLLRDHGLFILPNLPKRNTTTDRRQEHTE